jgi:hypothetical protein
MTAPSGNATDVKATQLMAGLPAGTFCAEAIEAPSTRAAVVSRGEGMADTGTQDHLPRDRTVGVRRWDAVPRPDSSGPASAQKPGFIDGTWLAQGQPRRKE